METNTNAVALAETLPVMQRALHSLYLAECSRHAYEHTEAQCVIDCDLLDVPIRIDAGSLPVIRVSGLLFLNAMIEGRTNTFSNLLRKATTAAHTRLRRTLSRAVQPISVELDSTGHFKVVAQDGWTLPERAFTVTYTLTVTCNATQVSDTVYSVTESQVCDALADAKHRVTALALASEQASNLLQYAPDATVLTSEDVLEGVNGAVIESLHYTLPEGND